MSDNKDFFDSLRDLHSQKINFTVQSRHQHSDVTAVNLGIHLENKFESLYHNSFELEELNKILKYNFLGDEITEDEIEEDLEDLL